MNTLTFARSEKGIIVTGNTFDMKEILKANGASWNPDMRGWIFRGQDNVDAVRAAVEEGVNTIVAAKKAARKVELAKAKVYREWLKTPAGQIHAAAERKARVVEARANGAYWICCDNCVVIDWGRKHTTCNTCYTDGYIRVRGCCYTGD